jgi:hypothetical protein
MNFESLKNFDDEAWTARFKAIVASDGHALRSWRTLTEAGVDAEELASFLALYCNVPDGPGSQLVEEIRTVAIDGAKRAAALAGRLEADRVALGEFSSSLPATLLDEMAEAANKLRSSANDTRSEFSKHKANTTFFLAWLVNSVVETTGNPHYTELSYLVECAYAAFGVEEPLITVESLRKSYARFKADNPFASLATPEGRTNVVLAMAFVAVIKLVLEGNFGTHTGEPKPTKPVDSSALAGKLFSNLFSLDNEKPE